MTIAGVSLTQTTSVPIHEVSLGLGQLPLDANPVGGPEIRNCEVPEANDAVNLDFVRSVVGKSRIVSSAIVCRTPNSYPLTKDSRAIPVTEL